VKNSYGVVVVGAGAAGIACCERLASHGVNFLLIEAKSHIGGRVHSQFQNATYIPIELGAEFIHGAPKYTLDWMQRFELPFYDVEDRHLFKKDNSHLEMNDYWQQIEKVMKKLSVNQKDISINEFLSQQKNFDEEKQSIFKAFVEGFHAADLNVMGTKELAATDEPYNDELNGSKMFRCIGPYSKLLESIFLTFANDRNFSAQIVLKNIEWQPNSVLLTCRNLILQKDIHIKCKKLVLTLPIGVLKSKDVVWSPPPEELASTLRSLEMGHVQRLVFHFTERFWENLSSKPVTFLHHTIDTYFPTWWSMQPLRCPYLVAWQGGPKAKSLATFSRKTVIETALSSLSQLTNKTLRYVRSQVKEVYSHDWSNDPFSRGAYSYVALDGVDIEKNIEVFADTVFLAGEAFAYGSAHGTVHGAFESGVRTAEKILRTHTHVTEKRHAKKYDSTESPSEIH
jgi:monoamine oxidase